MFADLSERAVTPISYHSENLPDPDTDNRVIDISGSASNPLNAPSPALLEHGNESFYTSHESPERSPIELDEEMDADKSAKPE